MRLRTFGGLWIEGLSADADAGPRPRALALLALLAGAEGKGFSRDRILGVLWPDSDGDRARHALSQTLYALRRMLGVDVVLSTPELRVDSNLLTSDLQEFRAAIRAKRWPDAAALYAGAFLEGFYLGDAPEFERWAESERGALAADGMRAIEAVAVEHGKARKREAVEHWRRLTRLDPVNSRFATSYMEALEDRGERAAALAYGKAHAELLQTEFEAQADPKVERLMHRLRSAPSAPVSEEHRVPAKAPTALDGRRKPLAAAAALLLLAVSVAIAWRSARARESASPVLAVGRIRDLVAPESTAVSAVLSEMLATSLSRINDLQVVANSRMLELTPRSADTSRNAHVDAARRAGATEIIEGELLPIPDRRLRLEVRRVDLRRGIVRGGYVVAGSDRIALFDSVATLVANDFRFRAPARSLASVSTQSPIAYRFYEEGLRAFYQFDIAAANRLLRAALREDSTFAMATYYAWRAAIATGDQDQVELSERASTLASRATARDRLLIATHVGYARGDLRAVSAAETLATKYPRDPEALIRSAEVIRDLPRAIELLNRSIALDSAAGQAPTALCRLCDAFNLLIERYRWADSTEATERTVRRWMALRPRDVMPWALLSEYYIDVGRYDDASVALRRYEALGGSRTNVHLDQLVRALRSDDVDATNTRCAEGLSGTDSAKFLEYRWYCTIGLRMQGRYREARALVDGGRVPNSNIARRGMAHDSFNAAILDMEMGRALAAVDEFRQIFPERRDSLRVSAGVRARQRVWVLTLAATAAVAGGDTTRARILVDSIEAVGNRSLYGRDQLLHHFIRGLLLAHAGREAQAVREYRSAMFSPTFGYTRVNYELGQSLMKLNRPGEAIPVVRAALRGGIEGSNLYITRTELHELLARAFDSNGQRDSATVHYAIVERAWRHADPSLQPRYVSVQRRLAALTSTSSR